MDKKYIIEEINSLFSQFPVPPSEKPNPLTKLNFFTNDFNNSNSNRNSTDSLDIIDSNNKKKIGKNIFLRK